MAQFKPKSSSLKAPNMGGGSSGLGTLLAYMVAQQKGQGLQQQLGPGAVATGGTDPATGARFETPSGQAMDVQNAGRKKAVTDAVTAVGSLKKIIPIIDEFEGQFNTAYPNPIAQKGISGKLHAAGKIINAHLENDPEFKAAIDQLEGKRSQITKGLGEVGNLAEQEQKIAMQNVPQTNFGGIGDLFLPESPATGSIKLKNFRKFIMDQINTNMNIINSGGDLSSISQPQQETQGSPQQEGRIRVRNKVTGQTGTVSMSGFDPSKYEKV